MNKIIILTMIVILLSSFVFADDQIFFPNGDKELYFYFATDSEIGLIDGYVETSVTFPFSGCGSSAGTDNYEIIITSEHDNYPLGGEIDVEVIVDNKLSKIDSDGVIYVYALSPDGVVFSSITQPVTELLPGRESYYYTLPMPLGEDFGLWTIQTEFSSDRQSLIRVYKDFSVSRSISFGEKYGSQLIILSLISGVFLLLVFFKRRNKEEEVVVADDIKDSFDDDDDEE